MAKYDFIPDGFKDVGGKLVPLDSGKNDDLQKLLDQANARCGSLESLLKDEQAAHLNAIKKMAPPDIAAKMNGMSTEIEALKKQLTASIEENAAHEKMNQAFIKRIEELENALKAKRK